MRYTVKAQGTTPHTSGTMLKQIAATATVLLLGATGTMAAEVGVRNTFGGSYRDITHGQEWSRYAGTRQEDLNIEGSSRGFSLDVEGSYEGTSSFDQDVQYVGRGRNRRITNNDITREASAEGSLTVDLQRSRSSYEGTVSDTTEYRGGSENRFTGRSWTNFSETSTFAR